MLWGEMPFGCRPGGLLTLRQSRRRAFAPQLVLKCMLVCRFKKELKKRTIPAEDYSELGEPPAEARLFHL